MPLPTIFETCTPRREVLAGQLPDSIFAADLWEVVTGSAHEDYQTPARFFAGSYPTENLGFLLREIGARLAGRQGPSPVFRLETGFGGGKTHSLIAAVHLARHGADVADLLAPYGVTDLPIPGAARVAAFVGEQSDPLTGLRHDEVQAGLRTYTPWGEIALRLGGLPAYEVVRQNDEHGVAPSRQALAEVFGSGPVLVLIDELVLYLARAVALPDGHPRRNVAAQMPTFLQTLFTVAAGRPATSVVFTLPSERDANRRITVDLKQHLPEVVDAAGQMEATSARQVPSLTPTQAHERAAVLSRRLFQSVNRTAASDVAEAYRRYYEEQREAGVEMDRSAFERSHREQMERGYPFHPELIALFAERLPDIPEFQATRGALRLMGRTIRSAWANRNRYPDGYLLQPHHVDLARPEVRDELLSRLGKSAYGPGLDADVVKAGESTHASLVEQGWPVKAATEAATVVFLHSLPASSRGVTAAETALALGRPGYDLAYVKRGLDDTEALGWYLRREAGDRFLFHTRASVNKRYQEKLGGVEPGTVREQLDEWVKDLYTGFDAFQVVPFPPNHTLIPDTPDRLRLVLIHYDKEGGYVGAGDRLSFTRDLFNKADANASPRVYRNNLIFLLAEATRIQNLKEAVRNLLAWSQVQTDLEQEQRRLAETQGGDYRAWKETARRAGTGVPAEFMALENDLDTVKQKLGENELNVRGRILEAYRVLAFPQGTSRDEFDLFGGLAARDSLLECYRVEFGETPAPGAGRRLRPREAVAQAPILQCLRQNGKLVPEPTADNPVVLAARVVRDRPLWQPEERSVATQEVWTRLRQNPELPMLLKSLDLLPTLRAGLSTDPEALWVYYDRDEKRVYTRASASELAPVLSASHFLYEPRAALEDRIAPVESLTPAEIQEQLWPRNEADQPAASFTTDRLLQAARASRHFPVMPSKDVLWAGLREGARERRWVLRFRGTGLAVGGDELAEWPAAPRLDDTVELWDYAAAVTEGFYPRRRPGGGDDVAGEALTPERLKELCWTAGAERIDSEELERRARATWPALSRSALEQAIREGIQRGLWDVWLREAEATYYTAADAAPSGGLAGPAVVLVQPNSVLAQRLYVLRPGQGPRPVQESGTPREALTRAWERLVENPEVRIAEVVLTVLDRDSLENTLVATWVDRPAMATHEAALTADGQRTVGDRTETIHLEFQGRFEEVRGLMAPLWSFQGQGELNLAVTLHLRFDPPVPPTDRDLESYRTALTNANQGNLEVSVKPSRGVDVA